MGRRVVLYCIVCLLTAPFTYKIINCIQKYFSAQNLKQNIYCSTANGNKIFCAAKLVVLSNKASSNMASLHYLMVIIIIIIVDI